MALRIVPASIRADLRESRKSTERAGDGGKGGISVLVARRQRREDGLMSRTRQVLVLAVDGCHSLNVFGPLEVFYGASIEVPGAYDVQLVGPTEGGIVRTDTGVPLGVAPLPDPPPRHDTLVVAGGAGMVAGSDDEVLDWVARASRRARRTASICTGAFLLAAAGVLDGRPAVTHWAYCAELQRRFERVLVDPDPVFINDGDVWTSAGSTAGIDLALALVEQDLGPRVAVATARRLVMFSSGQAVSRSSAGLCQHRWLSPGAAEPAGVDQRPPRCGPQRPGARGARGDERPLLHPSVPA